jgi:hypothetical protein
MKTAFRLGRNEMDHRKIKVCAAASMSDARAEDHLSPPTDSFCRLFVIGK